MLTLQRRFKSVTQPKQLHRLRECDYIMPTVLRIGSFRFHFYSDEQMEPPHIHIETPEGECKLNRRSPCPKFIQYRSFEII